MFVYQNHTGRTLSETDKKRLDSLGIQVQPQDNLLIGYRLTINQLCISQSIPVHITLKAKSWR